MLLQGKNIIVTGSNRGMGKAMVEVFAQQGANVWACARKASEEFEQNCQTLAQQYNVEIKPVYFDLSNNDEIKAGFKTIMGEKKPVDGLVSNAGVILTTLFQLTTIDKFKEVFQVNFFGPMLFEQYVSKLMIKQKSGSIVNIASTSGINPPIGQSAYGASKNAVIAATIAIAKELGTYGVRVNAIAPSFTKTDMTKDMTDDQTQTAINNTILKRMGDPQDVANVATFLLSDLSSYLTGQVIRVDGGQAN